MKTRTHRELGTLGETIAVCFLESRGMEVVDRNVYVNRDEIDIIYSTGRCFVAVEVKTSSAGANPFDALSEDKLRRVVRAVRGYRLPITALDAISVAVTTSSVEIRWLRGIP